MDPFLAAQADDSFEPTPMLIQADWLEERGDLDGAAVLRGLVVNGTPSLHALALEATLASVSITPDDSGPFTGDGHGRGHGEGHGDGDGHEIWDEYGYGSRYGYGFDRGEGLGPGIGDAFFDEHGEWHGAGYGDRDG